MTAIMKVLTNPVVVRRLEVLAVGVVIYALEQLITSCLTSDIKQQTKKITSKK